VATKDKVAVAINGGTVDRGDMARVDVFRKKNKKGRWEHYLVPIYPHQIATMDAPPNRAAQKDKDELTRPLIDQSYGFIFSLHPMCYLELVTSKGECIEGYFRELNSDDAGLVLSAHHSNDAKSPKTGSKTLQEFRKFTIDRLGRKFEVKREARTWRGKTIDPEGHSAVAAAPAIAPSISASVSSVDGVERSAPDGTGETVAR
jgi:CRISPR-associated endonuclease Csn1